MVVLQARANPLHLLRAILRECTYLPDEAARSYWHAYTVERFREYCPRRFGRYRKRKQKSKLLDEHRQVYLSHQARKLASILRRANDGHLGPLEKVLAYTYGRTGKRRHELLAAVNRPDVPNDNEAVLQMSATSLYRRNTKLQLPDSLKVLAKAQMAQPAAQLSRPPIRSLTPRIPKTNIWGRPLPIRRARNLTRKWYSGILQRILPPLPQGEWERLRDLAVGKMVWPGPIPRRSKCITAPQRINGSNPHNLTRKFMRRLWGRIFVRCPLMIWDPNKSSWTVQWGKILKWGNREALQPRVEWEKVFFDGVSENGKRPRVI